MELLIPYPIWDKSQNDNGWESCDSKREILDKERSNYNYKILKNNENAYQQREKGEYIDER